MGNNNMQIIKLFLAISFCTAYILGVSHFGVLAYDTLINNKDTFAEGTKITSVDVSGKTKAEAISLVEEQISKWLNEAVIQIQFKETTTNLNKQLLTFKVEETVSVAKQGVENKIFADVHSIKSILTSVSPNLSPSDFDMKKLKKEILEQISALPIGTIEIQLSNFLLNENSDSEKIIDEVIIKANIAQNDQVLIADKLKEIKIAPMSQFSLIPYIKELGIKQLSPEALNMVATGIYRVILPTNFIINERNISEELPSYAALGLEAKVSLEKNMDLVFSNPNKLSYKIEINRSNNNLVVSLKGESFLNKYKVIQKGKKTYEPKIIVQFNPQLKFGQKSVEKLGKNGYSINVYRETYNELGAKINKELISNDFYPPVHQIEVRPLIDKEEATSDDDSNDTTDEETDPYTGDQDNNYSPPPTTDGGDTGEDVKG